MTRSGSAAEKALEELQRLARLSRRREPGEKWMWGQIPEDLRNDAHGGLELVGSEVDALEHLKETLAKDERFEHMEERAVDDATWRFVCLASLRRGESHVDQFIAEHEQEPRQLTCYFPVELLKVPEETEVHGVTFIPAASAVVPEKLWAPDPRPTMDSVVAVGCRGTSYESMRLRAREVAEHALRLLRAGLREHRSIHDRQLLFRLGVSYWFSDSASGWQSRDDAGLGFELNEAMLAVATSPTIATLPAAGRNDVERRANRALRWFEQAQLAMDPLMELLFLFFALEAILGNKAEGEKARGLAIRRAILAHKTTGSFTHPYRVYSLYDEVRSTAVHGENPPEVTKDELVTFAWDVRRALNEFLEFARAEGFEKRGRVLRALDDDPDVDEIAERFLPEE
jgi:hypothetical protein